MRLYSLLIPLLTAAPALAADDCPIPAGTGQPMETATLIIEDNFGDGDFSLQAAVGDESLTEVCVFDPAGTLVFHARPGGTIGAMGVAGVTFETSEPTYAEMSYDQVKATFAEGQYQVRATDPAGEILTGSAWFTTVLPKAPEIVTPATVPAPDQGPVPVVPVADLKVEWRPVTESRDGRPVTIRAYHLWINKENHKDPHGNSRPNFDVHLGPDATSFTVPAAFLDPGSLYEIEVGAIEESGNQTLGGASYFATK